MDEPLGICMIGTGAIAADHMEAFRKLGITPLWAISRRPEAAEEFAARWTFQHWSVDLARALADPEVSLVVIASPSAVHAEQAVAAMLAGKDVVVEIPAGLNLADVEELKEVAGRTGRRVFVCHTMRSFPALVEAKRRVAVGELDITHVTGFFAIPRRQNQGFKRIRSWFDDLLWHHACHQIDATLWVLGVEEIGSARCLLGNRHPEFDMVMDLSLGFTCGPALVSHDLSYNADVLLWEIRFTGRDDVLVFRNGALLDESGTEVVTQHSIRELSIQNAEMLEGLSTSKPGRFDLDAVLPSYRALHLLDPGNAGTKL